MIKTFAELKRELYEGRELKLIWAADSNHKKLGLTRAIKKQQTNAVMFEDGSWLGLGNTGETAKNFTYQDNGFTVLQENYRTKELVPILKYQFIERRGPND